MDYARELEGLGKGTQADCSSLGSLRGKLDIGTILLRMELWRIRFRHGGHAHPLNSGMVDELRQLRGTQNEHQMF
jgi:hypothetical protein